MSGICGSCPPKVECDEKMELRFDLDIRPVIGGVNNYEALQNKPSINGVVLTGNKTNEELLVTAISNEDIEKLLKGTV